MNWIKERKNEILLVAVVFLILAIAAEVTVRIVKPQLTYSDLKRLVGSYYEEDMHTTFTLQKNYIGFEPSMDGRGLMKVTTNSEGV